MKRFLLSLSVLVAGLSMAGAAPAMDSGMPETQEQARYVQKKAAGEVAEKNAGEVAEKGVGKDAKKQARKQRRQQEMEDWLRDMDAFRQNIERNDLTVLADSLSGVLALDAVAKHGFVLEADYVTFRRGTRVMVNSGTNFISLNDSRAVVQVSPTNFYAGPNGVGGVTVRGNASDVKMSKSKNGDTVISMNVTGIGINAQVEIRLPEGTDKAYATVSPNFNSNTVRLEGRLVPFEMSRSIEGMSL